MNKNNKHILVVDDDDRIRDLIKEYLIKNYYIVTTAKDAFDAQKKVMIIKFDLIVLDIMMPGKTGLELTMEMKKISSTPIILLTAKSEMEDRVTGLETGADDYLGKPFSPKELLLRIKNILKKTEIKNLEENIKIGKSLINLKKLTINYDNKIIKINPTEKKILQNLISYSGKVFSRNEIGKMTNVTKERTIDVMITRLRKKIEPDPKNPKYLQTIRGSGYVLWIE
ncbi:MAG: DNA-binding response regulator [Candidatus Pelagibacter sp. TMED64]|nr:DNA-binding response regulator [Candidatus Pelagibacter sp.]OUU65369.1 MAG: DNA-binding response regulator [Candidatus Pelagibacter sp. TMED64]|tara:strand:- start:8621 stop:9298 length:678 start_codon:yes stop_codon:yes gene_type:complete